MKLHGKHLGGVVFEGEQYKPDADGVFELPDHFHEEARVASGLTLAPATSPVAAQIADHAECLAALEQVTKERDELKEAVEQLAKVSAERGAAGTEAANQIADLQNETSGLRKNIVELVTEREDLRAKLAEAEETLAEHLDAQVAADEQPVGDGEKATA